MRDLRQLRVRPKGVMPFAAFSDAMLREFETAHAVTLAEDYVEFLRFANGGALDLSQYDDPVTGGSGKINIFYGLGDRKLDQVMAANNGWESGNLWGETRAFRTYASDGIPGIPFARDGGDNKLFFDFRHRIAPVSRLIIATRQSYVVSPTFAEFVDMLYERRRPARAKWSRLI